MQRPEPTPKTRFRVHIRAITFHNCPSGDVAGRSVDAVPLHVSAVPHPGTPWADPSTPFRRTPPRCRIRGHRWPIRRRRSPERVRNYTNRVRRDPIQRHGDARRPHRCAFRRRRSVSEDAAREYTHGVSEFTDRIRRAVSGFLETGACRARSLSSDKDTSSLSPSTVPVERFIHRPLRVGRFPKSGTEPDAVPCPHPLTPSPFGRGGTKGKKRREKGEEVV